MRTLFHWQIFVIQFHPQFFKIFSGSFQPSNEMMLKFYAFYKQATEGQCTAPKPNFWDVVKKAKWLA